MSQIQSDYTSQDFLSKLLSKPENESKFKSDSSKVSPQIRFAQRMGSPKRVINKMIQFQVIGSAQKKSVTMTNLCSSQKSKHIDQKTQQILFNSPTKDVLGLHNHIQNIRLDQNTKLNPQHTSYQKFVRQKANIKVDQTQKNKVQLHRVKSQDQINFVKVGSNNFEHDLILKKTELFLKAVLEGKISNSKIQCFTSQFSKALQNPFEFDRLIENLGKAKSNIQSNQNHIQKFNKESRIQRPKSVNNGNRHKLRESRGSKSQQKAREMIKSKKQMKQLVKDTKLRILKQIKQMKHLVSVNERSLRLNKKMSFQ